MLLALIMAVRVIVLIPFLLLFQIYLRQQFQPHKLPLLEDKALYLQLLDAVELLIGQMAIREHLFL